MDDKIIVILKIFTYFALLPIIYRSLMAVDFNKLFKKNYVGEIRLLYFLVTILLTKIVGDFFLNIMELFMIFLNIKPL